MRSRNAPPGDYDPLRLGSEYIAGLQIVRRIDVCWYAIRRRIGFNDRQQRQFQVGDLPPAARRQFGRVARKDKEIARPGSSDIP